MDNRITKGGYFEQFSSKIKLLTSNSRNFVSLVLASMDVILEVLRSLNETNGIELLGNGKLSAALIQLNSPINCKCNVDYSVAKTSIEAIARWLNNPSTRSKLFALNILSWFTSSIIFNPQSSNSFIRQQLEQCVRLAYALINSESHDLSLMSLFVISTCELLWHKVGEDSTAQTGLLAALNSADSTQQYWAYRAVVNETKLHGSSHLLQTPGASDRLTSCIKTILECLSDGERRKMLLTQSYPQTGQESFLPLQLDLLLLIPIGKGLSSPLRAIVDICPAVSAAMW